MPLAGAQVLCHQIDEQNLRPLNNCYNEVFANESPFVVKFIMSRRTVKSILFSLRSCFAYIFMGVII